MAKFLLFAGRRGIIEQQFVQDRERHMRTKVVVVGGTGTVGSEVVGILAARGIAVCATTRDVQAAPGRAGIEWVPLAEPAGVDSPLDINTQGLFLMAPTGYADQHAFLSPWIRAAARAGVTRIVLMTAQEVNDEELGPFRRAELELIDSGISNIIVRPNWFMQNFHTFWGEQIRRSGLIALPAGDGKLGFIDARDIAAVAAAQLVDDRARSGTFVLTGPESLDHTQVANILSIETGRQIRYRDVDPDEFASNLSAATGMAEDYIRLIVDMFDAVRAGAAAGLTDNVQLLSGRPARSLSIYARDYRTRLS